MSHARVEELSDSDPDIDDPVSFLPQSDSSIISPANIPPPTSAARASSNSIPRPPAPSSAAFQQQAQNFAQQRQQIKTYIAIYPLYFDASRTRATGRRVSSELAIKNPLAYNIAHSMPQILAPHKLLMAFEPDKTHPKDWANPGRVRLQFFHPETHAPLHPTFKTKRHLFVAIAEYLGRFPTQVSDVMKLRIPGLPIPDKGYEAPKVPRGWKLNDVVPLHSSALSGGGVSDNFFKEAMEELRQAQIEQGRGGANGEEGADGDAGGRRKKEKRKG